MGLSVRALSKYYGRQPALRDISFELGNGMAAVLGPNGAGKTTLLRCLATAARPERGEIVWRGRPYNGNLRALRSRLGYLPQDMDFPGHLTPRKLLLYLSHLKHVEGAGQAQSLIEFLNLGLSANRPFACLSGGQVRLAGLAQAFLGAPELVLLDEAGRGLDLTEREAAFRLARSAARRGLVIFSTHNPVEAEQFAEWVIVLKQGGLAYAGTPAGLRSLARGRVFEARVPVDLAEKLLASGGCSRGAPAGRETFVRWVGEPPSGPDWRPAEPGLEDGYLHLTRQPSKGEI